MGSQDRWCSGASATGFGGSSFSSRRGQSHREEETVGHFPSPRQNGGGFRSRGDETRSAIRARGRGRGGDDGDKGRRGHLQKTKNPHPETKTGGTGTWKIEGTCLTMCPGSEMRLRETEGLLHKFETLPSEDPPSSDHLQMKNTRSMRGGRKRLPRVDPKKVVKSFARSAAGQDKTLCEELRPSPVLKDTLKYLLTQVLHKPGDEFNVIYDFIFDRLRAVRQDLVIQRIEDQSAIDILESIVKFHVYAEFRLSDKPVSIYDPHINQKHLTDCLRKVLSLYEYNGVGGTDKRMLFESLNCLVYPSSYDVLSRAMAVRAEMNSSLLSSAIDMALAFQSRNYVRFFRHLTKLPIILQLYAVRHVGQMRVWGFQRICAAYGVGACKIPLSWLTSNLLYTSSTTLHGILLQIGAEVTACEETKGQKYVKFQKAKGSIIQTKTEEIKRGNDIAISSIQIMHRGGGNEETEHFNNNLAKPFLLIDFT